MRATDASDRKLAEFYRKRGVVRGVLGRVEDQIRDLERALELADRAGVNTRIIHGNLAHAHLYAGNFRKAGEHRLLAIRMTPREKKHNLIHYYALLAEYLIPAGDLEAAEAAIVRAKSLLANVREPGPWVPVASIAVLYQ